MRNGSHAPPRLPVAVREERPATLSAYGAVSIAFTVRKVLACTPARAGLGGLVLAPRAVERPYGKNYDALDGGPARWPERFGAAVVARWGGLAAYVGDDRVGGAVVIHGASPHGAPKLDMLDGRGDLAVE